MTSLDRLASYCMPRARLGRDRNGYRPKINKHFPDGPGKRLLDNLAAHKSNYWIGFISDPATAMFLIFWDIAFLRTNVFVSAACYIAGLLSWSLFEYSFHRWVYHKGRTLAHAGHMMHHDSPRMPIGMPWFMTTGFLWCVWYVLAHRLQVRFVLSFVAGVATGMIVYGAFHHIQHHSNIGSPWFKKLRAHHRIHHRFPNVNFGVTNRFWDQVFGTVYRRGEYKARAAVRVERD